jgi:hypothetical protein
MALHLTKVAFGSTSFDMLDERLAARVAAGPLFLTTRYLPKRHEEIAGQGSLFWIIKHTLVARSSITGFGEAEDGRVAIHLGPALVRVQPRPKRAHQGWRYLEADDAPVDFGEGDYETDAMPAMLLAKLSALALL